MIRAKKARRRRKLRNQLMRRRKKKSKNPKNHPNQFLFGFMKHLFTIC